VYNTLAGGGVLWQVQEVSPALCWLLAHPQEAVGVVSGGRLAAEDVFALSEVWPAFVTTASPAAAAAAAAFAQQT